MSCVECVQKVTHLECSMTISMSVIVYEHHQTSIQRSWHSKQMTFCRHSTHRALILSSLLSCTFAPMCDYCVCVCVRENWKRGWDGPSPLTIRPNRLGLHYPGEALVVFILTFDTGYHKLNCYHSIRVYIYMYVNNSSVPNVSDHQGRTQSNPHWPQVWSL